MTKNCSPVIYHRLIFVILSVTLIGCDGHSKKAVAIFQQMADMGISHRPFVSLPH